MALLLVVPVTPVVLSVVGDVTVTSSAVEVTSGVVVAGTSVVVDVSDSVIVHCNLAEDDGATWSGTDTATISRLAVPGQKQKCRCYVFEVMT